MGVRKKIFIFMLSTAALPSLIYYRFLSTLNNHGQNVLNQNVSMTIFWLCVGTTLIAALIAQFNSYSIQKPMVQMIAAARRIEGGDFDVTIPVYSEDEIGDLAQRMNLMAKGLKERENIKKVFGQVVDPKIRDYLIQHSEQMGGITKEATILFCDLEGFSTYSENKAPAQVVELLNRYFEEMTNAIVSEQGLVNKYIGDAILAVFGAPLDLEDHADRALSAAFKMREALARLNLQFESEGKPKINNRIGIHSGEVLAGIIGSATRMEYTVIGDTVNIASRLEKVAKDLHQGMVISEQTSKLLRLHHQNVAFLDEVPIRGRSEPVRVYRRV